MRMLTVPLTPEQAEKMQAALDKGAYASDAEIVREALRLWEEREAFRTSEIERLKRAYEDGKASGEPEPVDPLAFLSAVKARR
jgi:antitoxin ParD1/3/4